MKYFYVFTISSVLLLGLSGKPSLAQRLHFEDPVALSDTINSEAEESYPIYSPKDSMLFFVRTLYEENTGGLLSGQDIWYSKRTSTGKWSIPKNDLSNLNNRNNNAVVGIGDTGNTLYVMNAYTEKEVSKPGLSVSSHQNQTWTAPKQINIPTLETKKGNHYSLYVPPTEDVVIISMQNDLSVGLEDLFVSLKDPQTNQWSKPIHLGPTINTSGFEISPFLSKDQKTLFFSSNGHPGYGNADIFFSTRLDDTWTNWTRPENLGDEINSVAFDAYLTINEENEVFFVSNRHGGSANIFSAKAITEQERETELANRFENRDNLPIANLKIKDADSETQALIEETQRLLNEFRKGKNNTTNTNESTEDKTYNSEVVYFDLNSYGVKTSATADLNQVVNTLKQNPSLHVKVIGHADDTGGKDYNLKLSIARAQAIKKYLADAGIDVDRIITFGKGSTQPVTTNESLEGRTQNRRVEIEFFTF